MRFFVLFKVWFNYIYSYYFTKSNRYIKYYNNIHQIFGFNFWFKSFLSIIFIIILII